MHFKLIKIPRFVEKSFLFDMSKCQNTVFKTGPVRPRVFQKCKRGKRVRNMRTYNTITNNDNDDDDNNNDHNHNLNNNTS